MPALKRFHSPKWVAALTVLGFIFLNSPTTSTTLQRMTLVELASTSEVVIHGQVISSRSRWTDDHSLIVTDTRVNVLDAIKGDVVGEVVITQPGGQIGKLRVDVPGASAFMAGEEVVLFLSPAPRSSYHVTGLSQGRFGVIEDSVTGERLIQGAPSVSTLREGVQATAGMSVGSSSKVTLDAFISGLRDLETVDEKGDGNE